MTTDNSASVLITGGSGYLGEQLIRYALSLGYKVRSFDIISPDDLPLGVEFVRGDIRSRQDVIEALSGVDYVVHAVASVPLRKSSSEFYEVNVTGTTILLESSLQLGVKKVIYVSSSAVYGVPEANPVIESSVRLPAESYGKAKLDGEEACRKSAADGLDVSIIRPRTILGAGRLGIFGILFDWINSGSSVPVLDQGTNKYQFVHVLDLCSAIFLALRQPGCEDFNIGGPEPLSMRDSLQALCDTSGTGAQVFSLPSWLFRGAGSVLKALRLTPFAPYHLIMYGESLWFTSEKAQRILGWKPRYSSSEALLESFDTFRKEGGRSENQSQYSPHRSSPKQGILAFLKIISKALFSKGA
jgi:nucleoside-diphosphate-sugar epimerase